MIKRTVHSGIFVFAFITLGQFVSLIGSNLTSFAIGVWMFQYTGSVTKFALLSLCIVLPNILIAPLSGILVDRWSRRWAMIISDSGAAICSLIMASLYIANELAIWHVYFITVLSSTFGVLRMPAYNASVTLLIPKQHLSRANGMIQLARALAQISSPILAGVLISTIRIQGIILIDAFTFLFAITTLLCIQIPQPRITIGGEERNGSFLGTAAYGWNYLRSRPGLIGLLILFAISNFLVGILSVLVTPIVLAIAPPSMLGTVWSVGGIGMLVGSIVMGIWGGPRRRVHGVLGFMMLSAFFIILGGLRPSIPLLMIAAFGFFFCLPISDGCSQTIMQNKISPDVQGRVFAITGMLVGVAIPLAYIVAGPLADRVFEPLFASKGALISSVGRLIGVGAGRGIGFMFIVIGILLVLAIVGAYLYPHLRLLEDELPDAIALNQPDMEMRVSG